MGLLLDPIKSDNDFWKLNEYDEVYFYTENVSTEFIENEYDEDRKYSKVTVKFSIQNRNENGLYDDFEQEFEEIYSNDTVYEVVRNVIDTYYNYSDLEIAEDDYIILNILNITVTK